MNRRSEIGTLKLFTTNDEIQTTEYVSLKSPDRLRSANFCLVSRQNQIISIQVISETWLLKPLS